MTQLNLDDYRLARRVGTTEHEQTIEARFWAFHAQHPDVYAEIVRRAHLAQARGLRVGIRTIWEAMRWDYTIERGAEAYKLNDHFTSRYARLIIDQEPDLSGFFELREIRSA